MRNPPTAGAARGANPVPVTSGNFHPESRMRRIRALPFLVFPFFFMHASGRPAFDGPPPGAISAGNGGVRIASPGPEAVFSDPCGIGDASSAAFGWSFALPYGIPALAVHAAALVLPTRLGRIGAGWLSTGDAAYRETVAGLAWSDSTRRGLRFGIRVRLLTLAIPRYGSWTGAAADFSIRLRLDTAWSFGGTIDNVNGASPDRRCPAGRNLTAGLLFEPSPGCRFSAETAEEEGRPQEWRFGAEAAVGSSCVLRGGWTRGPSTVAFGAGLRRRTLGADYACSFHPVLGATHRMDVVVRPRAGR
jgi:hypothetical protein